jgi:hypothetical protein
MAIARVRPVVKDDRNRRPARSDGRPKVIWPDHAGLNKATMAGPTKPGVTSALVGRSNVPLHRTSGGNQRHLAEVPGATTTTTQRSTTSTSRSPSSRNTSLRAKSYLMGLAKRARRWVVAPARQAFQTNLIPISVVVA